MVSSVEQIQHGMIKGSICYNFTKSCTATYCKEYNACVTASHHGGPQMSVGDFPLKDKVVAVTGVY